MNRHEHITKIADALRAEDHETFLVGGAVRDFLLLRESNDMDLATSARPDTIERALRGVADAVLPVGKDFGVVIAMLEGETYEIATFRGDRYDGVTRKPVVTFTDSINDDLKRRDFTINAMAIKVGSSLRVPTIIDPTGGIKDLKAGVIRTPGNPGASFIDDPLRMIRAARFAAKYGFSFATDLETAVVGLSPEIRRVSAERIRDEMTKLLLVEDPTEGLDFIARTGLSDHFLPELNALRMDNDSDAGHKDVYWHTFAVVRNTRPEPLVRWAALLHDIAKPSTFKRDERNRVSFHYHEVIGADMANDVMRRLKFDNKMTHDVTELVRLHLRAHSSQKWTDKAVRRYIRDAGELLDDLNHLQRADVTTRNAGKARKLARKMDELEARIAELQEVEGREVIKPPLNGREVMQILGIDPGPYLGQLLKELLEVRLDRGPMTREEAEAALREIDANSLDDAAQKFFDAQV